MSSNRYRIIFILIFVFINTIFGGDQQKQQAANGMDNKEARALFPQIEYTNEWFPVGQRDPLKDPTYDYMPPVGRVRYWQEGSSNKSKKDILLLGVPSKVSSNRQTDKYPHGPVKRTYFAPQYQIHHTYPHQKQFPPQRLMPPPKHERDSYPMSTNHHFQHNGWKTANAYMEYRPENSISTKHMKPLVTATTAMFSKHQSMQPFLPTIPPSHVTSSTSFTLPMSTETIVNGPLKTINGHMMPSLVEKPQTKPLLHSILQTETATPFTKKPSSVYQIEYNSNNNDAEAINSMATSSSLVSTFTPTKPTLRPIPMKTTSVPSTTVPPTMTTTEREEQNNNYVQPDLQASWPTFNQIIIEGHSKVKTYGSKNDDAIGNNLPKIRPVQPKENPVVERVTNSEHGPEFMVKHRKEDLNDISKKSEVPNNKSTMTSLLSLLDSSFGNFFSDASNDKVRYESENKIVKNEKEKSEKKKNR